MIRMDKMFEVEDITLNDGDIVLSEEDFDRLVTKYDLPVFKYEYNVKHKKFEWENKVIFTIFNGVRVCLKTETVQVSSEI